MNTPLAILAATCLWGQQTETNAVEALVVSDQAGAAIKEARIVVVAQPENFPQRVKTDEHGRADLRLNAGEYKLSISAPGFVTATQTLTVSNKDAVSATNQPVKVVLNVAPSGFGGVYYPSDSLVVSDPYHAPIVFSLADFRALPHITIKVHNGHTDAEENYAGVPLETLLAKANAPVGKEVRKEALRTYLLASGTNGYSVLLSLAEVDSTFHASQVIVADTRDGQPLGKNGPFQLIVPGDSRPARWVHNLNSIKLQQAQ